MKVQTSPSVLLLSRDLERARLLSELMGAEDCTIAVCASPWDVWQLPPPIHAVALVVQGRPDSDVRALVQDLRACGSLSIDAPVYFLCDGAEDWEQIAALGGRLIAEPVNLLDVAEQLRRALPRAPAGGVVRARGRITARQGAAMASARRLARWWAGRATGVLCVEGWTSGWPLLAQGGLVGDDARQAVEHALLGQEASIEPCEVDEPGDRAALGALLWRAARDAVAGESVASLIPVSTGLTRSAVGLPLSTGTRRCLERLGGVSIGRLARRERADPDEVCADLAALRWLGLLGLRDASAPRQEVSVDLPSATDPPGFTAEISADPGTPTPPSRDAPGQMLDKLVRKGIAAVSASDWGLADALLTRAHRLAPDNATVAAHLGWTRSQNPDLPVPQREVDALDLVERALQIDPACALAWRYCGELASARGDIAEANRCFGHALRLLF